MENQKENLSKSGKYRNFGKSPDLKKSKIKIEFSKEKIKDLFPNLAEELENPRNGSYFSITKQLGNSIDNDSDENYSDLKYLRKFKNEKLNLNSKIERISKIKKDFSSKYEKNSELYNPKTEDFLRKCSNFEEAKEIIKFQLKQNEISKVKAKKLLDLCKLNGLRYFGLKKKNAYYERKYRKTQF